MLRAAQADSAKSVQEVMTKKPLSDWFFSNSVPSSGNDVISASGLVLDTGQLLQILAKNSSGSNPAAKAVEGAKQITPLTGTLEQKEKELDDNEDLSKIERADKRAELLDEEAEDIDKAKMDLAMMHWRCANALNKAIRRQSCALAKQRTEDVVQRTAVLIKKRVLNEAEQAAAFAERQAMDALEDAKDAALSVGLTVAQKAGVAGIKAAQQIPIALVAKMIETVGNEALSKVAELSDEITARREARPKAMELAWKERVEAKLAKLKKLKKQVTQLPTGQELLEKAKAAEDSLKENEAKVAEIQKELNEIGDSPKNEEGRKRAVELREQKLKLDMLMEDAKAGKRMAELMKQKKELLEKAMAAMEAAIKTVKKVMHAAEDAALALKDVIGTAMQLVAKPDGLDCNGIYLPRIAAGPLKMPDLFGPAPDDCGFMSPVCPVPRLFGIKPSGLPFHMLYMAAFKAATLGWKPRMATELPEIEESLVQVDGETLDAFDGHAAGGLGNSTMTKHVHTGKTTPADIAFRIERWNTVAQGVGHTDKSLAHEMEAVMAAMGEFGRLEHVVRTGNLLMAGMGKPPLFPVPHDVAEAEGRRQPLRARRSAMGLMALAHEDPTLVQLAGRQPLGDTGMQTKAAAWQEATRYSQGPYTLPVDFWRPADHSRAELRRRRVPEGFWNGDSLGVEGASPVTDTADRTKAAMLMERESGPSPTPSVTPTPTALPTPFPTVDPSNPPYPKQPTEEEMRALYPANPYPKLDIPDPWDISDRVDVATAEGWKPGRVVFKTRNDRGKTTSYEVALDDGKVLKGKAAGMLRWHMEGTCKVLRPGFIFPPIIHIGGLTVNPAVATALGFAWQAFSIEPVSMPFAVIPGFWYISGEWLRQGALDTCGCPCPVIGHEKLPLVDCIAIAMEDKMLQISEELFKTTRSKVGVMTGLYKGGKAQFKKYSAIFPAFPPPVLPD
jgi:hypothetical protein